jgi:hypothetical protein
MAAGNSGGIFDGGGAVDASQSLLSIGDWGSIVANGANALIEPDRWRFSNSAWMVGNPDITPVLG